MIDEGDVEYISAGWDAKEQGAKQSSTISKE